MAAPRIVISLVTTDLEAPTHEAPIPDAPAQEAPAVAPEQNLAEAGAVAEAQAIIDPAQLQTLAAIYDDQARTAEALAQAAKIISAAQTPIEVQPSSLAGGSWRGVEPVQVYTPAAGQIRDLLNRNPLFLDYETTHLHKKDGAAVCEVSILNAQGRPVFHSWVDPQQPVPAQASAIHGLASADVDGAPIWSEIAPTLRKILQGRVVVAYSAQFERKFTPKAWDIEWVCAKKLTDQALGRWPGQGGLQARLKQCGLPPGPEHTAQGDNLSTLRLLRYLAGLPWLDNSVS